MTFIVTVFLLACGLGSFVDAYPLRSSSSQYEGWTETDLMAIVNALQNAGKEQSQWGGSYTGAKEQAFVDIVKKFGGALCKTIQDPSALAEAIAQGQFEEAQTEGVKQFLKKLADNLCKYITQDDKNTTQQVPTIKQQAWPSLQKHHNVEMQGFFKTLKTIGNALCRAARDGSDPNIVLTERARSLWQMEKAEIESIKSFFKGIGSKLCDYISKDKDEEEQPTANKQETFASETAYQWPQEDLSKVEIQGFLSTAKKIGSALCGSIYTRDNPTAIVDSFELEDEVEIQRFTDFLKRFGSNLCKSFTGDKDEDSKEDYSTLKQISAELQEFLKGIANRGREQGVRYMPIVYTPNTIFHSNAKSQDYYHSRTLKLADIQSFLSKAKKIGSALCRAAYDGEPQVLAEGVVPWGEMDKAEAQRFKDFLKRFGSNLCDYITEDDGNRDTRKKDLVRELLDMVE